jgi:hypothetical protein
MPLANAIPLSPTLSSQSGASEISYPDQIWSFAKPSNGEADIRKHTVCVWALGSLLRNFRCERRYRCGVFVVDEDDHFCVSTARQHT